MRLGLSLLCAILALTSLFKLSALNSYEDARGLYRDLDILNNPSAIYSTELASQVTGASKALLATNQSKKLEASYLMDLARALVQPAEQIKAYCKAFGVLDELIKSEPYDSKTIINWLDVQQIIQNAECGSKISEEERKGIIDRAVKNDPTNTNVLYSAGLLYIWTKQKDSAIPLFHDVLRLSTKLSTGHQSTILNLISSKEDFEKLVPARFPQINEWTSLLKDKNPEIYNSALPVIEKMQMAAIGRSLADMQGNIIPARIHLSNLESMLKYMATENVRKLTYEYIADLIGFKSELGEYLRETSKLTSLNVAKASKSYDTLPYKGVLADWNSDKDVVFDAHETSIGFRKDRDAIIKTVELVSSKTARRMNPGEARFFTSDDNQLWQEVTMSYRQVTNPNIDKTYLVIDIKSTEFKYFKINFHSPAKRGTFFNKGTRIINVYG